MSGTDNTDIKAKEMSTGKRGDNAVLENMVNKLVRAVHTKMKLQNDLLTSQW